MGTGSTHASSLRDLGMLGSYGNFLDSACRVFQYMQAIIEFRHPLPLVLCENRDVSLSISPYVHIEEPYEDNKTTYSWSVL